MLSHPVVSISSVLPHDPDDQFVHVYEDPNFVPFSLIIISAESIPVTSVAWRLKSSLSPAVMLLLDGVILKLLFTYEGGCVSEDVILI